MNEVRYGKENGDAMNENKSRERFLGFLNDEIDRRAPPSDHAILKAFAIEVLGGVDFEDMRTRNPADVFGTIYYAWQYFA